MSLFNKSTKLINKFNDYNNTFNNRVETLNLNPNDNDLRAWNKSKILIMRDLTKLDTLIMNYIKHVNSAINKIENKNNLSRFGNVNEYTRLYLLNVNQQQNINLKVVNSLKYGSLLLLYNVANGTTLSEDQSGEFFNILLETGTLLAGGYINMAVNYPDEVTVLRTDLDMYVSKKNALKLLEYLYRFGFNSKMTFASAYQESFFKKNGLVGRINMYKPGLKIDVLIIRDDFNLVDVIKNFDLSFCSVYLDPKDLKIKGNIKDLVSKKGILNDEYAQKYLLNKFIQKRIKKYKDRGYSIRINAKIDITIEKPPPREITDASFVKILLQDELDLYGSNIPTKSKMMLALCMPEYTPENLIKSTKELSFMLYDDEKYFYYMLVNICTIFISNYDDAHKYPAEPRDINFKKIRDDMVKFKEYIIMLHNENGVESKYINIPDFFTMLFKYFDYSDVHHYLENFRFGENLTTEYMVQLQSENPSFLFNQLLIEAGVPPNYVNLILYIVDSEREHFEGKNKDIKYWFLDIKPTMAMEYNRENFYTPIVKYSRSIDYENIIYFDPYMYTDLSYEEAIEDSNYLLFIMGNKGFTYDINVLTQNNLQDFFVDCNTETLGMPVSMDVYLDTWYFKVSIPYNVGIDTSQIYQAMSIFENSNKKIRVFVLEDEKLLKFVSNINVVAVNNGKNVWGEYPNIVSETHCNTDLQVFESLRYIET